MSDTRRQIADRHAKTLLTSAKPDFMILESAMSEYAAAVLEECAEQLADPQNVCDREFAIRLRARAAQERER